VSSKWLALTARQIGVYNNWDCFLYHPAKRQFLLWFEQAFADYRNGRLGKIPALTT